MKASGLTQENLELIVELEIMEKSFLDVDYLGSPELAAKCLVCLAHDYVSMGLEEKGHELLMKADQICPDYFKYKILTDARNNDDFGTLVHSLAKELILIAISTARDNKALGR